MQSISVLVLGVGGLGTCMVREALDRGLRVSVLIRDESKLDIALGHDFVAKLHRVEIGDGAQPDVLDRALPGIDVVLSGLGAVPEMARSIAEAVKRNGVAKLCWPAGTTNVVADNGVTSSYKRLLHLGRWVEGAYHVHGKCISAIESADINYIIFCAGRMSSLGRRSLEVENSVRINRDAGPFVSYEDAAWVMLEAAVTSRYDGKLISAATQI